MKKSDDCKFLDKKVATLSQQLSLSHFVEVYIVYLINQLKTIGCIYSNHFL